MEGANIVTEGLGSSTLITEGYGYLPRATKGAVKTGIEQELAKTVLLKLRQEVAQAFSTLRMEYGPEMGVEAILAAIDDTILAQPGVYKLSNMNESSPNALAIIAYKGG